MIGSNHTFQPPEVLLCPSPPVRELVLVAAILFREAANACGVALLFESLTNTRGFRWQQRTKGLSMTAFHEAVLNVIWQARVLANAVA